jgi:hypothetical protein
MKSFKKICTNEEHNTWTFVRLTPYCMQPVIEDPLWWQEAGLSFTATGYGSRIPTVYKMYYNSRWHRVFHMIYSNSGTTYIETKDHKIIVELGG